MYLARKTFNRRTTYIIRETYNDAGTLRHRDLLDLGGEPQQYIIYTGSSAFYIDDRIVVELMKKGVDADPFDLERLFYPFLDPHVKYRLDAFADRAGYRKWKPMTGRKKEQILQNTHIFDRRRLHFLRFGQIDQRRLAKTASIYNVLLDKSRDEIEQHIMRQEMKLKPNEYKLYLYTVFDLQSHFTESYSLTMPEALDVEKMDHHFLKQICSLDRDENFWTGLPRNHERLADYLVRYVIMYFDFSFASGGAWEDYLRSFMDSRRRFVPPTGSKRMSMSEVSTVFGVSRAELSSMSRRELKRMFRKKARELHPDKGGDHNSFIELAEAYNEIMRTRR